MNNMQEEVIDIPCVIFAGGYGTRMGELTESVPKPLIDIYDRPIIFHLIDSMLAQGVREFYILAGYRQEMLKEALMNYRFYHNDIKIEFGKDGAPKTTFIKMGGISNFSVYVLDTGIDSLTGLRLKRALKTIKSEEFILTYGDGLSDVNLSKLIKSHRESKKLLTVTGVPAPERFGVFAKNEDGSMQFTEKKSNSLINGGFMVLNRAIESFFDEEGENFNEPFETCVLQSCSNDGQLNIYRHDGFWRCMDTPNDKKFLDSLCEKRVMPWLGVVNGKV
jgi:glucose-1-phosphate cytidylyltransferase